MHSGSGAHGQSYIKYSKDLFEVKMMMSGCIRPDEENHPDDA